MMLLLHLPTQFLPPLTEQYPCCGCRHSTNRNTMPLTVLKDPLVNILFMLSLNRLSISRASQYCLHCSSSKYAYFLYSLLFYIQCHCSVWEHGCHVTLLQTIVSGFKISWLRLKSIVITSSWLHQDKLSCTRNLTFGFTWQLQLLSAYCNYFPKSYIQK